MTWLTTGPFSATDARGVYELHGSWRSFGFEWRARVIATDELVQASWDRVHVEACVVRHAARAVRE